MHSVELLEQALEIAKKLGTEGHLTKLQRIAVGDFVVQDSIPLKEFEAKWMSTEH